MADETSSIALQLNVSLRGLINLTKLNSELVALKRNAQSFQRGLNTGNNALSETAKQAQAAATKLKALTSARRADVAATARASRAAGGGRVQLMEGVFKPFSNEARAREKAAAQSVKARIGAEQMYARMFDQIERQNVAKAAAAGRQRVANTRFAARQQNAEYIAQSRIVERTARIQERANQRVMAVEKRRLDLMGSLHGRLKWYEEQNDAVFRAGFRLQMLGNDMQAVGQKTISALVGMSKEFGDFEFMVNRAAGASNILSTATTDGTNIYQRFKDSIQATAQELRLFSPTEVAQATYFWASTTGQQVNSLTDLQRVMQSVNPLMKVAAMTQTEYETAIKGVYAILVQYGMSLDQTQGVVEKLQLTTQKTAAEFPDLINSFKMVGPVAKEFGVTFEDMLTLLGRLADAGIRGTMSGRAFRQFFIQLSRPSAPAKKALDALWASTKQFGDKSYVETVFPEGQFIGVNAYVDELAKRLQNASDSQRMFTLASITTANELPVLTALVSKQIGQLKGLGTGWDESKEDMSTASEMFRRQWDLLATSWNGTIGALRNGVEILRLKVGERIAQIFTPVLDKIAVALDDMRQWFSDPSNQGIVDFFVKFAAAAGGILAVGGALTVLLGSLIALGGAFRVAWGAFKPLFGAFAKFGGVVVLFGQAIVRNFDYITDTLTQAFNTIRDSLKGSGAQVEDVTNIFKGFGAVVAPVLDAVIYTLGQLVLVFSNVFSWVMKNKGALDVLTAAANVLGAVIATRMVFGVARAIIEFTKLNKVLGFVRASIVQTAVVAKVLGTGGFGGLKSGITGLAGSLRSMLPVLGPGGWLLVGLAAVAGAFAILYTNSSQFKGAVDRLVQEWITSMDELIAKTEEVYRALGQFGPEAKKALRQDAGYRELERQVNKYEQLAAKANDDGVIWPWERSDIQTFNRLSKELQAYTRDTYETYANHVQQMNDLTGQDILLTDWMSRRSVEAKRLGVPFSDTKAHKATWDFFLRLGSEVGKAEDEALRLVKALDSVGQTGRGYENTATLSPDQRAAIIARLVDLQSGGQVSSAVAREIERVLGEGTIAGVAAFGEDAEGLVTEPVKQSMGEIGQAMITAARGTLDIGNVIREAMKTPTGRRQAQSLITEFIKGPIAKGFRNAKGQFKPAAELVALQAIQDFGAAFQTQFDNYPVGSQKKFAENVAAQLTTDLKPLSDKVTPAARAELAEVFRQVYSAAGQPVPQGVLDKIYGKGKVSAANFNAGIIAPESTTGAETNAGALAETAASSLRPTTTSPNAQGGLIGQGFKQGIEKWKRPINTLALGIGNSTKKIGKHKSDAKTWGSDLGSNFWSGLSSWVGRIISTAQSIATGIWELLHQTTAEKGPLRDTDVWGYDLGKNIADGMKRSKSLISSAALDIANTAALANSYAQDTIANNGISVESNANRVIKVQIEVTSPDGSVDRLKAADLERGLMTSDLILSLEHMATVG